MGYGEGRYIAFNELNSDGDDYDLTRFNRILSLNYEHKEEGKDHESIQSSTHLTQDTIWESDKNTRKHHIQESQEVSPFPAGDHKTAMNRQDSTTGTKHK